MVNKMKFRFYGQEVIALLISNNSEGREVWAVWVDSVPFGTLEDNFTDETDIMRFVEKKILENLAGR